MTTPAPAPADLCTEAEIRDMVHTFYGKARADDALGPVFNGMVHDWDEHLATLSDFWSAVLLGTRRFSGMPMPKHVAMPNLSAALFERWLVLFAETTDALPNRALADAAQEMAERMARSLWYGYQVSRNPDQPLTELRPA
ncbi:hemoglobin [Achromobacter sp. MFA1 R4]|nr:hemoglobin [Achromobacter sp. MFA1 R4]